MRVIMIRDVGGVGQRGKVVNVSDGHALNYLIPNGFAVQATPEKVAELERKNAIDAERNAARDKEVAAKLKDLDGKKVVIKVKANDQGHLFKKVKKDDVVDALANMASFIDPSMINDFGGAIAEVGEHVVHVVGAGVEAAITIAVEAAN